MDWEDARNLTLCERRKIGFDNLKDRWRDAGADYTTDNLKICGHPVMERWEDGYMKELADIAAKGGGRVLEIGFGMGLSASFIQLHPVEEHVIIEANRDVFARLRSFAAKSERLVTPLFGFWENVVSELRTGSFDGILFDTYPLTEDEVHQNHYWFFREAFRLLKTGGKFTYYSDEPVQLSIGHIEALMSAGFVRQGIGYRTCEVNPPADCQYWRFKTIVVPIITK